MNRYRCQSCGWETTTEDDLERFAPGVFGHVVAVAGKNGEPEPDLCGPVAAIPVRPIYPTNRAQAIIGGGFHG